MTHISRRRRRWMRRVLVTALAPAVMIGAVFGWAALSTGDSTIARVLIWQESDIGDQYRFPSRTIETEAPPSALPLGTPADLRTRGFLGEPDRPLRAALRETDTRALIVVHDDRIVYEDYADGAGPRTTETSFSAAKSFLSTLVGIAIERGSIGGLDDAVTDYVPELAQRDPEFARITIRDLLTMRSGLRYEESSLPWPFGDDTYTYLGTDLRRVALDRSQVEEPPGRHWLYNNYNPLLIGLVLERATGMSVSEYMSEVLWKPLGAADDATWSLDSRGSGFEKMESGLNATARDYARFGLLFQHDGRWNGRQIVPVDWVRAATAPQADTPWGNPYGDFWWIDGQRPENFYAFGDYGQYIYVAPHDHTVIVRIGGDWGTDNPHWLGLFHDLIAQVAE